jgi:hypothetical protein
MRRSSGLAKKKLRLEQELATTRFVIDVQANCINCVRWAAAKQQTIVEALHGEPLR